MNSKYIKIFRLISLILIMITIILTIIHVCGIIVFNNQKHTSVGNAVNNPCYMFIHPRHDSTSTWEKIDMDLTGTIYDATLYNNSTDAINDWTMRINIKGDCYLNQFWNGQVEIHQNVGTDQERVQTLELNNYDISEIELNYIFDEADILIHLQEGDYIIYYPSDKFKETLVMPHNEVIVGGIFYYSDKMDMSDYSIEYNYSRRINQGVLYYLICIVGVLALLTLVVYISLRVAYNRVNKEMNLRISGISCMSALYEIIYIVDIVNDTITPVGVSEDNEKNRPKDLGANEQFANLFSFDAEERYRDTMIEFANLKTLPKRLENRNSIAIEYESINYGWCRIRFIVMDREKDKPVEKVLFTIERINLEKKETEKILGMAEQAESESKAKSAFLANMSHEIRTPINAVLGLDTMILRESTQDSVRAYARDIKSAGNMLLSIINSILDYSKLEAGKMELIPAEYSLKELIYDVNSITKTRFESKNLAFVLDVNENIPDRLFGDDVRLKQVIINLLTNAAKYTDEGSVRLGIYGKVVNDTKVHLLISVKDTGMGIKPEDQKKLAQRYQRFDEGKNRRVEGTGIGMNLVSSILEMMDSKLNLASIYGQGSDFYFEIEQKIVDKEPIGKLDLADINSIDMEDYQVAFTAPDARVLVVDDNPINLSVFENLLKQTEIQIDKATSGKEALQLTLDNSYDIIFMDHMMPGMDGIEAMKQIKAQVDGKNRNTIIIVLTANAMTGDREGYLKVGFNDFISKPIDPDVLEDKLMNYLPESKCNKNVTDKKENRPKKESIHLPEINGVDTAYALEHIGSTEGVLKIMEQFVAVGENDAAELRGYLDTLKANRDDKEALDNFRIKVHAMKTSASLCGALQVYGVAAKLEYAARDGKVQEVYDITPYFLDFWMELHAGFEKYFGTKVEAGTDKKQVSKDVMNNLLHQLTTSMNNYDIKGADIIIKEIENYDLGEKKTELFSSLKTAVAMLDVEKCENICKEIMAC